MTHFEPESDGSKTKRRSRRSERRADDDEGGDLDRQSLFFDERERGAIASARFLRKKSDEVFPEARSRLTFEKSKRKRAPTNKEERPPSSYCRQFHSSRHGFTQSARQGRAARRMQNPKACSPACSSWAPVLASSP